MNRKNPGLVTKKKNAEKAAQRCLSLYENSLSKRDPRILRGTLPSVLCAAAQTANSMEMRDKIATTAFRLQSSPANM